MNAQPADSIDSLSQATSDQHRRTPLYEDTDPHQLRVVCVVPASVPKWLASLPGYALEHEWLKWTMLPVEALSATADRPVPQDLRMFLRRERSRRPQGEDACAATSIAAEDSVPASGSGEADLAAVCARVLQLQPDLILLLGPRDWLEPLASCARRGCWIIDDNLFDAQAAAQALLLPLLRGETATAIELELSGDALSNNVPPTVLATSWSSTCHTSASQQCDQVLRKLPALLLRALRRLSQAHAPWPPAVVATLRLRASPLPAGSGLRALVSTVTARAKLRWQRQRQPHMGPWLVAIRTDDSPLDPEHPGISRFQVMAPAEALGQQIWADPCVVEDGGRRLVFVEERTPEMQRAHLACIEVPAQGPALWLGKVLDRSYHLSFPQVFRWEEQWYMTVESGQAGCVTLHRAERFPLAWQPVAELITQRHCVDPVLHHHQGRWYLFVNVAESGGNTWDELFLFVSDSLTGPFVPHPENPIVADVRRARPAGRLFHHQGRLIRPSQDCAASYGSATVFNEVLELSPTAYRERPLGRLDASWAPGLDACHTYSAGDTLEVVDMRGMLPAQSVRLPVLPGDEPLAMSGESKVSVVMPAHNAASTILASMRSVLEQTHSHLELIVVDDGSTDGTWQLIEQCAATDRRVVAVRMEVNQGVAGARNAGIRDATGRYIAFLDSDDRWHPRKLEIQLACMRQSGARASYTAYERMAPDGRPLNTVKPPRYVRHKDMLKSNGIGNLTGLYDRSLGDPQFQKIGHEDYVFWLQIVRLAGGAVCAGWPDPLAYYLTRPGSLSANKLRTIGWQWQIYRQVEGLGRARSAGYLLHYAARALAKRI